MTDGHQARNNPVPAQTGLAGAIGRASEAVRTRLDRTTRKFPPVITVAFFGALTAVVAALQLKSFTRGCGQLTISVIKLEVTFSAERFAAILGAADKCGPNVVRSLVTWDVLFPVCYGLLLCTTFWWCERWRRVMPGGSARSGELGIAHNLAILAPLAAAVLDMLAENIPLWIAGTILRGHLERAQALPVKLLVVLGSAGATIKWVLLLFSVCLIVAELVSGPRGHVAGRLRFSVLAFALAALPLLAVPQGQDTLQRLVEGENPRLRIAAAVPALLFTALAVWYTGRKLLQFCFHRETDPGDDDWYAYFAEHLPRVLGVAFLAVTGAAFARAGLAGTRFALVAAVGYATALLVSRYAKRVTSRIGRVVMLPHWKTLPAFDDRIGRAILAVTLGVLIWVPHWLPGDTCWRAGCELVEPERAIRYLRIASWLCLVAAWGFYLHVYSRRDRLAARQRTAEGRRERQQKLDNEKFDSREPNDVSAGLKVAALIGALASLAVLASFTFAAVPVGRFIGPLWVLALAVANAVFVGSITVWVRGRYGFRLVTFALVAAVLFSIWNDNHIVAVDIAGKDAVGRRRTVSQHLDEWLRARPVAHAGDSLPVVLVAAAGGGLRAAYWAASTLAAIQDEAPSFSEHVFAVSGVSGGSLGVTLFTALSRDAAAAPSPLPCVRDPGTEKSAGQTFGVYSACVRYFLRDDFLSPTLAKMLAPDFAQWFIPFPVTTFDRSKALEGSWDASYLATSGRRTFAEGIAHFGLDTLSRNRIPALFLNSTHVETGRRYIASTLRGADTLGNDAAPTTAGMLDAPDVLKILDADVPLSAAVHNSARFTYVSPAGRLDRNDGIEYGHVVDGGYFENSGLATLLEVLNVVQHTPSAGRPLRPIIVYLCNDPIPCARDMSGKPLITTEGALAGEWLAPARAVLQARGARGSLARAEIQRLAEPAFFQLNVCDSLPHDVTARAESAGVDSSRITKARDRVIAPPLGWLLSRLARSWMDSSLAGKRMVDSLLAAGPLVDRTGCRAHNAYVQARLASWLGAAPAGPSATVP